MGQLFKASCGPSFHDLVQRNSIWILNIPKCVCVRTSVSRLPLDSSTPTSATEGFVVDTSLPRLVFWNLNASRFRGSGFFMLRTLQPLIRTNFWIAWWMFLRIFVYRIPSLGFVTCPRKQTSCRECVCAGNWFSVFSVDCGAIWARQNYYEFEENPVFSW